MNENMKVWNAIKQPPADALKQITGGRLKGMTDVSPMYRYRAMTEQFGMCGVGWKFTVEKLWTEEGTEGQKMAFASILLYFKDGEKWSDPIPGIGGSMLIVMEKAGLHSSDEAYKMAVTDALSTSTKLLGMAADIYAGKWDGTKYATEPDPPAMLTKEQKEEVKKQMKELNADEPAFLAYIAKALKCSIKSVDEIPANGYALAIAAFKAKREAAK